MPTSYPRQLHPWFGILLEDANWKSVYQNIEFLMVEVYKFLHGPSPDIVITIFKLWQNTYNPINFHVFESQNLKAKLFGLDCIAYRIEYIYLIQ